MSDLQDSEIEFAVGDRVRLSDVPPYVKTADSMPMLRPPNVVKLGEEGIVLDRRLGGLLSVRFAKGAFLIDSKYLKPAIDPENAALNL